MDTPFLNKGKVSNLATFSLLAVAYVSPDDTVWRSWILAASLFGFAGGITNWLAVKMLFDRVPLLYGSGVIPQRFREIRTQVKFLIMQHFFDVEYLQRFLDQRTDGLSTNPDIEQKLLHLLASPDVEEIVERKIEELQQTPSGAMLKMVGMKTVKPLVLQFLTSVGVELVPRLATQLASPGVEVEALRQQIDELLAAKLEELTPEVVKSMIEDVIRRHLGWLIVWGNVFGGLIGLLAHAVGY